MLAIAALLMVSAAPPAGPDCQAAMGGLFADEEPALPEPVDGAALAGRDALLALRRSRGDALIVVNGGDFSGADLRGARLHNICFVETDLAGSDWRGAEAPGIGFVRANLERANFAGARLPRILLREPNMKDVDASGADLSEGKLDGGWGGSLEAARFDRANLRGFRFDCGITIGDGCPLDQDISFRGADLSGASLNSFSGSGEWAEARLDRTEISLNQLREMNAARIAGPVLLAGGDASVELSPAEHAALLPRIRMPSEAERPSFDCGRARSAAEREICGELGGTLRALDLAVAGLYRQALAVNPGVAEAQQAWLRERDRCTASEAATLSWCLERSYEVRKAELIAAVGPPSWAIPGAVALFIEPRVDFDPPFADEPLYRRLLPVIVGAAFSRAVVRVNPDGTIDARGESVGANAHTCTLTGDGLRFDSATGWYSGERRAEESDPPEWRGRPMRVLQFWGDRLEVFQGGHARGAGEGDPRYSDYASCGARAGFGEMIRVPVEEDEARRMFETYSELD
ncbi:MAG TPA: pentapeptide repeat-containing protein [Allosphingosinicella sp.]|nr:pentapeptide repeat-containing protein [Allosphingosinicella sp.]